MNLKNWQLKPNCFRVVTMIIIACSVFGQRKADQIRDDILNIPRGQAVRLDGVIAPGEWDHAARVRISITPDWTVNVLLQHDDTNLYVAFIDVRHGGSERYPEVLLDPGNEKSNVWKTGRQWWLHASFNLCESNTQPNQYAECAPTKAGWNATRFPLKGASEMAISLNKVGISPAKPFGLALDVTDTKAKWNFWPQSAKLEIPMSWQTA